MERKYIILQSEKTNNEKTNYLCGYCKITKETIQFYFRDIIGDCKACLKIDNKEMNFNIYSSYIEQEMNFKNNGLRILKKEQKMSCIIKSDNELMLYGGTV